jgi:hypothetical protein
MAIVQISKIQQRRGLQQDLPQLASGELGWSIDARRLYIGNGTVEEGSPQEGRTEILTQFSILNFSSAFTANIDALQANVIILQSNVNSINSQIVTINEELAALSSGSTTSNVAVLSAASSGTVVGISANNAVINYSLLQGAKHRSGIIKYSFNSAGSRVMYDEDYNETATTDTIFTMSANSTHAALNYSTTTATNLLYRIQSLT